VIVRYCRELKYVLEDAGVSIVLSSPDFADQMVDLSRSVGAQHFSLGEVVCITSAAFSVFTCRVKGR
jgi:hypothetical protein